MLRRRRDQNVLGACVHRRCNQHTHDASIALADVRDLETAWLTRQVLDAGSATVDYLAAWIGSGTRSRMQALGHRKQVLETLRSGNSLASVAPASPQLASPALPPIAPTKTDNIPGSGSQKSPRQTVTP